MLAIRAESESSLDVKDGPGRVGGVLVLGGVTDQAFLVGEGDIRRGDTVSLVVDENLNLSILHHTDTTAIQSVLVPSRIAL